MVFGVRAGQEFVAQVRPIVAERRLYVGVAEYMQHHDELQAGIAD